MKKFLLLSFAFAACVTGAKAYWLPTPVVTSETIEDGKVNITWDYDTENEDSKHSHFVVTVFKMHKAVQDENFVLASTDFDYIESTGKMYKAEDRGALWDQIDNCPGWWVRMPMYMKKAIGVDAFQYFAGSDNSDIFGGAYIISPDYDLTNLSNKVLKVSAELGNEATSVSGGYAIWAFNTNWWGANNVDYKPVYGLDKHYDTLNSTNWTSVADHLALPDPEDFTDEDQIEEVKGIDAKRTRVMFYGVGYSAYWVNKFEVSVDLLAGESVDYGAEDIRVDGAERSFSIDTTGDTEGDYVYAYEVRAINEEYDSFRELNSIRATNYSYATPKHVVGDLAGIENVVAPGEDNVVISANGGCITVNGVETAQVYSVSGACVYNGRTDRPINVGTGVFVVKAGSKTAKVAL